MIGRDHSSWKTLGPARLSLGFERGRELSTQPAASIVEAAKTFGQSDDITVVTVARNPSRLASYPAQVDLVSA